MRLPTQRDEDPDVPRHNGLPPLQASWTWTRPPSCHDCDRKHGELDDGSVLCSGWPFYKKEGDAPCQNGKMAYGKIYRFFERMVL